MKPKEIGAPRPEEAAQVRKELDALNQQVKVTWDAAASGWLATETVEEPAEQFLFGWELTCVFPLPAASGKLTLSVLGIPTPLDVPGKQEPPDEMPALHGTQARGLRRKTPSIRNCLRKNNLQI